METVACQHACGAVGVAEGSQHLRPHHQAGHTTRRSCTLIGGAEPAVEHSLAPSPAYAAVDAMLGAPGWQPRHLLVSLIIG